MKTFNTNIKNIITNKNWAGNDVDTIFDKTKRIPSLS